MRLLAFNRVIGILILLLFSFSCASDLDYDQVNTLKLEPVFVSNLAYFDILAKDFVTNGVEQSVIYDAPVLDVFNDDFFRQRLKKVELSFEMENTISRAYSVDLVFLDKNHQRVHAINFTVPAYTGLENKMTKTETFENAQLDLLKRTTRIAFTLTMSPGALLNEDSAGSLKLRSGATAYLVLE
ncbi:hypothetical protein [Flavobacterium sp. LB2P53]|uniref:hypothetical protein n=1 Tax=Flavobacterium sp. LB2P53 TaxID=2497481 RepID=UPI000F81A82B|nr:hypothetical protein [Flavobacterium sp. LB2P53]RTY64593.1 hypothetical protein EKL95_14225 [Flavobacterium sp. LB2P53]